MYQITATFEGYSRLSATAWASALDGTSFPACTTIQFNYKPSVNQATVTVEPRATQVTAQNLTATEDSAKVEASKTPEQMQQEAESGGGLTFWHEFSWWYPWYRLHVNIKVNPTWDIGFSPLLPDEGTGSDVDDIWDFFEGIFQEFAFDFIMGLVKIAGARIGTYLAERWAITWPLAQAAIFGLGAAGSSALLYLDWNNKAALYGGAFGALMVMAITGGWKFAPIFAELTMYLLQNPSLQSIKDALTSIVQALTAMITFLFRSIIDVAEILFGATLVIVALSRASTL